MNVSIFQNITSKQPLPGFLEGVANLIRSDEKLKVFTESYRQTGSKTFKSECPLFAVACLFEGGKGKENVTGLTGLSLVDFDHIVPHTEDISNVNTNLTNKVTTLAEMKAKIIADPHTLMCYTTVSGEGLRIIFKYELSNMDDFLNTNRTNLTNEIISDKGCNPSTIKTEFVQFEKSVFKKNIDKISSYYQSAFYTGNAYYEKLLGCKADMQCKNLTRLSGLAHDPEVFLRPESEAVPFTAEEISTASIAYAKQSKGNKQMQRIQTYFDTLIAPQLAKDGIVFQSGSHNNYVMRVGYRLAERRFSKKVAVRWAVERFGKDYPDTEQVVNSCFTTQDSSNLTKGERQNSKFASVEDIKSFLDGHAELRFNEITRRVETQPNTHPMPSRREGDEDTKYFVQGSAASHSLPLGGPGWVSKWVPLTDRIVNSLWSKMSEVTRVNKQDMYSIIESDYVPLYHPFKEYLSTLEKWMNTNDPFVLTTNNTNHTNEVIPSKMLSAEADERFVKFERFVFKKDYDYIRDLANTVRVKGGEQEQTIWYHYLKKWLVAMVASWLSDDVVNNVILVLIGEQGAYKTTWFNYLLPPELKQYFYTKTNANRMSKDDLLTLAQYGLVCCEELDTMRPSELNQLKAAVTMSSIDERAAYARYHEHRKHIASFCGTGNNTQFLSDPTGNRRWLPFEVESIVSPREHPFNYEGIYAQALALYKSGFQYWFTKDEIQELNRHNKQFETPRLEHELVDLYFRKPTVNELGEFMSVARALQIISNGISQKLSAVNVGRAFCDLGFKRVRTCCSRGFIVVCRTAEEIKAYQHRLSADAQPDTTDDLPF